MTKYTEKSFSVAVGSKAYRDNWDTAFKGEALSAAERDYRRHLAEGMPEELARRIRAMREYADKTWATGRKEAAQREHDQATRLTEEWRASKAR